MKTGKFAFRIMVFLLVFFVTMIPVVQALNVSECEGECCLTPPISIHPEAPVSGPLNVCFFIASEPLVLLSDTNPPFRVFEKKTADQRTCHKRAVPPCFRMAQANEKLEGLMGTTLPRAYPVGMVWNYIGETGNELNRCQ